MVRDRWTERSVVLLTIAAVVIFAGCIGAKDSDKDGHPDEDDHFPEDPTEWLDSDRDGVGDNSDAFPNDSQETEDKDGDGYGDNSDEFPDDPDEWYDTDGDGYGDNSDEFPEDWEEWSDRDGDGHGDNSDDFPDDPQYHLTCPECKGTGRVPETDELNYTANALLSDQGTVSSEWHIFITVKNEDTAGGIFEVEAWLVLDGEELYRGTDEHHIDPGKSYRFDIRPGSLSQLITQRSLNYRVKPPSWVVGPEIVCPICGGTGKE
ncbi:MAG: hypothetical protein HXS50_02515 [Theionarchaea archaeon]|nr:hypothetical protein [Theionarchaea archaeon]